LEISTIIVEQKLGYKMTLHFDAAAEDESQYQHFNRTVGLRLVSGTITSRRRNTRAAQWLAPPKHGIIHPEK
jgi:hypothetical protein